MIIIGGQSNIIQCLCWKKIAQVAKSSSFFFFYPNYIDYVTCRLGSGGSMVRPWATDHAVFQRVQIPASPNCHCWGVDEGLQPLSCILFPLSCFG